MSIRDWVTGSLVTSSLRRLVRDPREESQLELAPFFPSLPVNDTPESCLKLPLTPCQ